MKRLERYILTEFAKLLAMAMAAFVVLFLMIDVFENMGGLMKHNAPRNAPYARQPVEARRNHGP
ncbi:MAG: hypothetical protein HZB85_07310 [Deltaproteobacteria bacterium]|nr:hypothetical protein [Deltaproteobacteria bacterium]